MKKFASSALVILLLGLLTYAAPPMSPIATQVHASPTQSLSPGACTSFCLDNGDHCVFGTNLDNPIDAGLLFVNKRHVRKTGWDPSTSGEYARWISRYGSLTFVMAGYQLAWAGMNEAGLMISTMALDETENPAPDERPPLTSPFWIQYQLDNHSTVAQVIASESQVRIAGYNDHYLVCDRTGDCATIEFLHGALVYHTAETLPVRALTNSTYDESVSTWLAGVQSGFTVHSLEASGPLARAGIQKGDRIVAVEDLELRSHKSAEELFQQRLPAHQPGGKVELTIQPQGEADTVTVTVELGTQLTEDGQEVASLGEPDLLWSNHSRARFALAADRVEGFEPTSTEEAVAYAFTTLDAASLEITAWSIVMDPVNRRIYFHTNKNPQIRTVDLAALDFSCHAPVTMLDVHAGGLGDIGDQFVVYSHQASLDHTLNFVEQFEGLDLSPLLVDVLLGGLEHFPCLADQPGAVEQVGRLLEDRQPLLPPPVGWGGLAMWRRMWPVWIALVLLSLAFVIWDLTKRPGVSGGRRLAWVLVTILLGPFGLLAYLLTRRKVRREVK